MVAALGLLAAALAACPKETPKETPLASDAASAAAGDAGDASASSASAMLDGRSLVTSACLSCHTEEMLAQQRLTEAQWTKTVTKMVGWGANLEPHEVKPLALYLSASYGLDAGAFEPAAVPAAEAVSELVPQDDAPFPPGDAERGRAFFTDRCAGCHGTEARGHIGVNLVERPILYRAADLAKTVRKGRGKMVAMPLTDAEVGDVLAHLRRLRLPAR